MINLVKCLNRHLKGFLDPNRAEKGNNKINECLGGKASAESLIGSDPQTLSVEAIARSPRMILQIIMGGEGNRRGSAASLFTVGSGISAVLSEIDTETIIKKRKASVKLWKKEGQVLEEIIVIKY